jgi:predicted acyltransferase
MGMISGYILLKKEELGNKINQLFFFGFLLLFLGDIMQWVFPLNKNLWSSSFSLLMGGITAISLASSLYIFDLKKSKYKFKFAHVFGVNSIFSYSLSSILTVVFYSSKWWGFALNDKFINLWESIGLPLKMGSLVYALFYVIILWVPTYYLYKNKVFIKL